MTGMSTTITHRSPRVGETIAIDGERFAVIGRAVESFETVKRRAEHRSHARSKQAAWRRRLGLDAPKLSDEREVLAEAGLIPAAGARTRGFHLQSLENGRLVTVASGRYDVVDTHVNGELF